jgi:hypothetical protein
MHVKPFHSRSWEKYGLKIVFHHFQPKLMPLPNNMGYPKQTRGNMGVHLYPWIHIKPYTPIHYMGIYYTRGNLHIQLTINPISLDFIFYIYIYIYVYVGNKTFFYSILSKVIIYLFDIVFTLESLAFETFEQK